MIGRWPVTEAVIAADVVNLTGDGRAIDGGALRRGVA
jgi:hypothetical protein